MKTFLTRMIREQYPYTHPGRLLLITMLLLIALSSTVLSQVCVPSLTCVNDTVLCNDPKASLLLPPAYMPEIADSCDENVEVVLLSYGTIDTVAKCTGEFSDIIWRNWRIYISKDRSIYSDCRDTTYVIRTDISGPNLICPSGRDTIECGDEPNPIENPELRAPMYGVVDMDTFPLYPENDLCHVTVTLLPDDVWSMCGNTKIVKREWWINDGCGNKIVCYDTLIVEDNAPPDLAFDTTKLSMEMHPDLGLSGSYLTDTIGSASNTCVGHGLLPRPSASDACSDAVDVVVDVSSANGYFSPLQYNATESPYLSVWNVPIGKDIIIYKTRDDCWNERFDTIILVVQDETPAVAVCHDLVNLSLTNVDQFTFMKAGSMNAESYDNCGIYQILARRVDWETACDYSPDSNVVSQIRDFYDHYEEWVEVDPGICQDVYEYGFTPEVPFCCADVGNEIMVEIMVIDGNCNVDRCWGMVNVGDNLAPIVVEPLADDTITCGAYEEYYVDIVLSSDTNEIRAAFGKYVLNPIEQEQWILRTRDCNTGLPDSTIYWDGLLNDNCGSSLRERYTMPEPGCATTFFKREFIATLSGINGTMVDYVFATQKIFIEKCDLAIMDISLLMEDTTIEACGITYGPDGNVDITTPGFDLPENLPVCGNYAMGYFDKVLKVVAGPGCYKVLRTWCLVDWCEIGSMSSWSDLAHNEGVITLEQTIKIVDNQPPVIEDLSGVLDVNTINCTTMLSGQVEATDSCGPVNLVEWYLRDGAGSMVDKGFGRNANSNTPLPPGDYSLLWRATDECNNTGELINNFTINSGALPTVIAKTSLSAELTPMDTNNNNVPDMGMVEVWGQEFNSSSAPPCGGDEENLIFLLAMGPGDGSSTVPPDSATSLVLTCADYVGGITPIQVQFWVKDTVYGTADFVNTMIMLENNGAACAGLEPPQGGISGNIMTEKFEYVANVNVKVKADQQENSMLTSLNGAFQFLISTWSNARIKPEKDTEHSNGISTLDLLKIQKHILGIKPIDSPYKLIASDANRDQKINAIDIIQFRKLVLGTMEALPQNTSWRFVDATYQFEDPTNALNEPFPEYIETGALNASEKADFIAVKLGDLDDNVVTAREKRNAENYHLTTKDQTISIGNSISVPIRLSDSKTLEGIQVSFSYDSEKLVFTNIETGIMQINQDMIQTDVPGIIKMSWIDAKGKPVNPEETLFHLIFKAKQNVKLSDALTIGSKELNSEVYFAEDEVKNLGLAFSENESLEMDLGQNRPNPFMEETTIEFSLPVAGNATLTIYDPAGKIVKQYDNYYQKGRHEIKIHKKDLTPGVLYYELRSGYAKMTKRMILIQ